MFIPHMYVHITCVCSYDVYVHITYVCVHITYVYVHITYMTWLF